MKKILVLILTVVAVLTMVVCAQAEDTIKIGFAFPISGNAAMAGKYSIHGAQVLEKELGGKIEIKGVEYPIEFVFGDTEGSEEKTVNIYQKLIEEDQVIAIVGPDSSKCALAAGTIAQNAGCPNVVTFATNVAVTQTGDMIFRACFTDPFQGDVAAAYAMESGYKTAVILFNNADAFATGLTESFIESFTARGGEILSIEEYSGSDVKDYYVQLTKLAARKADFLFLPNLNVELGLEIWQARNAGIESPIICSTSADTAEVAKVAGPAVEGVAYVAAFSAESTAPAAVDFVEKYTAMFPDELPNSNAELTYEAATMILYALRNAETLDREGVRNALASLPALEMPSGVINMGEDRNPVKAAIIMQYDAEGVAHYVSSVNP